jgi:ribosomal protein bL25 (Ctc-form)
MAVNASLSAQPRAERGKGGSRKLRAAGRVPAVVYGHGEETRSLTVDAHELERLFSQIHVENTIITLRIDGEKADVRALVREVQAHPVRGDVLHVDFYQIHAGERITVQVPISLSGTPEGVKLGGILQHALDELEIRCVSRFGQHSGRHHGGSGPPGHWRFHSRERHRVAGRCGIAGGRRPHDLQRDRADGGYGGSAGRGCGSGCGCPGGARSHSPS